MNSEAAGFVLATRRQVDDEGWHRQFYAGVVAAAVQGCSALPRALAILAFAVVWGATDAKPSSAAFCRR